LTAREFRPARQCGTNFAIRRVMTTTSRRTRSISAKVTEAEYTQIVARATPTTVSEWAREILVTRLSQSTSSSCCLPSFLALRTIILNLHFSFLKGLLRWHRCLKRLIDRADREKVDRARRQITELGAAGTLSAAGPRMTNAPDKSQRQSGIVKPTCCSSTGDTRNRHVPHARTAHAERGRRAASYSRKAIYTMIERAQLPGVVHIGRRVLVREDALLDWLRQRSTPSLER